MPTPNDLEASRNLALQKIGRNVVNFQKMEAMLKYILTFANLEGSLTSDPSTAIAQRAGEFARRPMGRLVVDAASALHLDPNSSQDLKEDALAGRFFYSFTIGESGEAAAQWQNAMNAVVSERNALVHQMLATFDPSSLESCESLSARLDEQRSRIIPAYQHLESIVIAIRESHRDLANIDGMADYVKKSTD
jgi:hypothetical protein